MYNIKEIQTEFDKKSKHKQEASNYVEAQIQIDCTISKKSKRSWIRNPGTKKREAMRNTNTNRSKKSTHSCIRIPSTNKREAIRKTCPRSHLSVPPSICLPPPPHPTILWELLRKVRTLTIVFVLITYWRFVILFESVTKKTRSHKCIS